MKRITVKEMRLIQNGYGFTKIAYFLSVLTIVMMAWIYRYFQSDPWGIFPLLELGMAITGFFCVMLTANQGILVPKIWSPFNWQFVTYALVIWGINMLIQILVGYTFAIGTIYRAMYVLFAAIAETLFFQGVLCNLLNKIVPSAISIVISAAVFMMMHTNYYGQPGVMISVFIGGAIYGYAYNQTNSITVPMLGHLFLNAVTFYTLMPWGEIVL